MTWQTASHQWPDSTQAIQTQSETVLKQVAGKMDESANRVETLASKVALARHPLSTEAESLLHLRAELESLMCKGQILCVHPYQYQVGNQVESGQHLSPDTAIETLRAKLFDVNDKHKPTGQLYALGWMIAENSLANFAQATKALFDVVNIPELGMVARRTGKEQSLQTDKFTKPNAIIQPRFKPTAHINQQPIRSALNWQGAQLAQLESLAADKNTPAQKLAALAQKRTQQLEEWTASLNQLKQSNVRVLKFEAQGTTEVIATMLKESQAPSHANSYTFSALFLSAEPLTFLTELFA